MDEPAVAKRLTPPAVILLLVYLWLVFAITTYSVLLLIVSMWLRPPTPAEIALNLLILVPLGGLAVVAAVTAVKLRAGRNWARILVIVLSALNIAAGYLQLGMGDPRPTLVFGTAVALAVLWLARRPNTREWCGLEVERREPGTGRRVSGVPVLLPVLAQILLWSITLAVPLGSVSLIVPAVLENLDFHGRVDPGNVALLVVVAVWTVTHAVLNIGVLRGRDWARQMAVVLFGCYGALAALALSFIWSSEEFADLKWMPAAGAAVAVCVVWLLLTGACREWRKKPAQSDVKASR